MTNFTSVTPMLSKALTKRGYKTLTPVQNAVLEEGGGESSDILVSAQTGSGKTVAFGLAMAPALLGGEVVFKEVKKPLALVIAPTRELALQVKRELQWLYELSGATLISCVGGMDARAEKRELDRGPHIVVGTPGRLCDHIKRGYFDTSELKTVVLDEADEMLDMGFRDELEYILNTMPEERRTLLFSATLPKAIVSMAKRYQKDAKRITTKEQDKQHSDIEYKALLIAPNDRENSILNVIRFHNPKNTIIFCATRKEVNHMTSRLKNRGFSVVALSGELSQNERSHALQALRDGRAQVCVATDVASRGIDLPDLELVIHADLPKNKDIMLHRSGRTGRAGRKGISALIVPHNWRRRAEVLLKNAKVDAKWDKPPSIEDILKRDNERFLSDPALTDSIKDEEQAFVKELLDLHSPAQVAAALIRLNNRHNPAPEELLDVKPQDDRTDRRDRGDRRDRRGTEGRNSDGPRPRREDFENGVWVSLSIGRNASAEARWVLPMLCGAGNLTKKQIGSIKINEKETHIELSPECVEGFFKAVGPTNKVEKNIVVKRLNGKPKVPEGERGSGRKDDGDRGRKDSGDRFTKKKYGKPYKKTTHSESKNSSELKPRSGSKGRSESKQSLGPKPRSESKVGSKFKPHSELKSSPDTKNRSDSKPPEKQKTRSELKMRPGSKPTKKVVQEAKRKYLTKPKKRD